MSILPSKFSLYDVEDVESLCRRVLDGRLKEWGAHLRGDLHEDALSYLVSTAWELSEVYDPSRGQAFSTFAYRLLRVRLVDWYRQTFGDDRYGERPKLLSLEAALAGSEKRSAGQDEPLTLADTLADAEDWTERVLEAVSARVPVERLSPAGRWTLHQVARPIAAGQAVEDVARGLSKSRRHVNRHLEELRQELVLLEEAA